MNLLSQDFFGGLPQPGSGGVVGALLNGQFEKRLVVGVRSWAGLAGGGGQGEAAGLLDARYVYVEPLAWLELSPSATVENSREGRGRYVDCVLLAQSESERFYAVIDGSDGLDGDGKEAIVAGLGRCSLFMAEAGFGFGTRLHHAAQ